MHACALAFCRQGLRASGIAPALRVRSAETWVEWALPGAPRCPALPNPTPLPTTALALPVPGHHRRVV